MFKSAKSFLAGTFLVAAFGTLGGTAVNEYFDMKDHGSQRGEASAPKTPRDLAAGYAAIFAAGAAGYLYGRRRSAGPQLYP